MWRSITNLVSFILIINAPINKKDVDGGEARKPETLYYTVDWIFLVWLIISMSTIHFALKGNIPFVKTIIPTSCSMINKRRIVHVIGIVYFLRYILNVLLYFFFYLYKVNNGSLFSPWIIIECGCIYHPMEKIVGSCWVFDNHYTSVYTVEVLCEGNMTCGIRKFLILHNDGISI